MSYIDSISRAGTDYDIHASELVTARTIEITGGATAAAQSFDGTADVTLNVTALDATKLSGTVPIGCIPSGAVSKLVVVADTTAMYALTTAEVQNGDTVQTEDDLKMYYVKDDTKLGGAHPEQAFAIYVAGEAASVAWSNVTSKPSTFAPSSHTHGNITDDGKVGSASGKVLTTGTNGVVQAQEIADAGIAAASHTHGSISNDGKIGSTSGLLITTGTNGALQAQSIADAGVAAANHDHTVSEITDFPTEMTPASHTHGNISNDGKVGSDSGKILTTGTAGAVQAQSIADAGLAAAIHTHDMSDVTGLGDALNGKAAATHNHTVSQITDFPTSLPNANAVGFRINTESADDLAYDGSTAKTVYFIGGTNVTIEKDTTTSNTVKYTISATDTDTHWTANLLVAASADATASVSAATSNPYLILRENSTNRNSYQISGDGATTVITDTSGNIVISSTDTDTHYTTAAYLTTADGTANASTATSNATTYLRIFDDTTARSTLQIIGSGATNVSAIDGVLTINSTDTDTHYTTAAYLTTATGTENASSATSNTTTYLRVFDDSTPRATLQITGTGGTSVSAVNGVLTINSSTGDDTKLPLDGGTMTGTLTSRNITVQANYTLTITTAGNVSGVSQSWTNLSLPTGTSWSGSGPYTYALSVSGIKASDIPIIDMRASGTYATDQTMIENWGLIYRAVTAANSITFYATDKPSAAIPVTIQVIR